MKKACLKLLAFSVICCIVLSLNSCDKYSDDLGEINMNSIQEYLNNIGSLPPPSQSIKGLETIELSRTQGPDVTLAPPFVSAQDVYRRDLVKEQKTAFVSRSNNIPFKLDNNVWPGNLIQGASLAETMLSAVPLSNYRKPGTIYLNVVSGQENMEYSREITEFTGSTINQAMNDIMSEHTNGLPADVNYTQHSVRSQSEMAYWLDMSEEEFESQTGSAFSSVSWGRTDKSYIMVKLEQIYFTMAVDNQALDDIFRSDIPISEIEKYTGPGNPLCYISSVSYGRYFLLLYECDSRIQEFSSTIDKIFNDTNEDPLTNEERMLLNTSYNYINLKMVQIGGNAEDGLNFITNPTYENFRNFVMNGSKFDKDNVGAPIYYNLTYAHNGQTVTNYKSLNTTYENYEYYMADNDNEVEITIKNIYSSKLVLTGGNWHTNSGSRFSVSDINIALHNNYGNWQVIKTIPTGIKDVNTTNYATSRSYYQKANLGSLGHDKNSQIRMSFSVTYTNVRGKKNDGKAKDTRTQVYNEAVFFKYYPNQKKWEVDQNQKSQYGWGRNVNFSSVNIADNFNFYNVIFNLTYEFKANCRIYPF